MDTNVQTMNTEIDNIVGSFSNDDIESLMSLTGQSTVSKSNQGLSRLNINYDVETEDGQTLTRGDWKMMYEGEMVYAKSVLIRPILRTYEWSVFDPELGNFKCKSVQKPTMSGDFPDTEGGNKCGRLSPQEEEKLSDDDPVKLQSRTAVCNQVLYCVISGNFVKGNKEAVKIESHPVVAYFKKSGFVPMKNFIESLTKQKKIMQKCWINMATAKQKKGSVTYWTPVPTLKSETDITDQDKELMKKFAETVKAANQSVLEQSRDASKLQIVEADENLANDFNASPV
jgi:hypothetical protein